MSRRAAVILLLAWPAAGYAAATERGGLGHEEFRFIGWNDACSAAMAQYRFPALGEGIQAEPSYGRIGTLTLPPDETKVRTEWVLEQGGKPTWDKSQATAAEDQLSRGGYSKAGYEEIIRAEPAAKQPGLDWSLRSTATFEIGYEPGWPPSAFSFSRARYSPLGTCALLIFELRGATEDAFRFQMVRVPPDVRRTRAQWHLNNAILLYTRESDSYGGLDESATAAAMDPRFAEARYYHAVLLSAHGRFDEAIPELRQAVLLDPRLAGRAKEAVEFRDIRGYKAYKEALRGS